MQAGGLGGSPVHIVYFHISATLKQGVVYLYSLVGKLLHKFTASNGQANDKFGFAIASYGKMVVIGTGAETGKNVYVFDLNSKEELHKLTPTDSEFFDYVGRGVAIYGNIIMVAANPLRSFCAVYTFDASNGTQLMKFTSTDCKYHTENSKNFGTGSSGMAIHARKNVGIVGHQREDRNGTLKGAGAVYVFDLHTGLQIRKITPTQRVENMSFGYSLLVFDDFLLVGAPGADSGKGKVYVFEINADWMEISSFGPCDNLSNDWFGTSMAMSGQHFIITAKALPYHAIEELKMFQKIVLSLYENGAVYVGETRAGANCSKFIHVYQWYLSPCTSTCASNMRIFLNKPTKQGILNCTIFYDFSPTGKSIGVGNFHGQILFEIFEVLDAYLIY